MNSGCGRSVLLTGAAIFLGGRGAVFGIHSGQFLQLGIDAIRQRATLVSAFEVLTTRQNKRTSDQSQRYPHAWPLRSIRRRACTGISIALLVFLSGACHSTDEPPLPERVPRQKANLLPEPSATASDAGNPWVKQQLDDLRDRTLKWTPRDEPLQRLVFAGERLFAVLGSEIVVLDATGKTDMVRFPMDGPHQLTSLADHSVLGVGLKSTFQLRPGAKNPDTLNKVMMLPQNQLFGSASDASRFDVLDAVAGQWTGYGFEEKASVSSLWLPECTFDASELKQAHCAQLLDGGYSCFANDQLWHLYSRSRPKHLGKCGVGLPVWRVLGGPRADQLLVARSDGQLEKWWFGPPPKRLSVIQLPWTPLDLSVNRDTLAVIRILQERAKPKRISLVILDIDGRTRFEQSLLPNLENDSNTIARELREAEVVVHSNRPWVAVHTAHGLRLLNALTGETLMEAR